VSSEPHRIERLEERLEEVLRRLAAVEAAAIPPPPGPVAEEPTHIEGVDVQGSMAYSGWVRAGKVRLRIRFEEDLSSALEADPEILSRAFSAMGSPFRILIIRALLAGPRTSHELQEELRVGAVGQLYHHLKELLAAGLIVQRRRSLYAIREEVVMPVCLLLGAVTRILPAHAPAPPGDREEETQG
jgi:ArsR family transcriptional regulator, arsenate/arsenite/antimonite-responsive transcriptional repressor